MTPYITSGFKLFFHVKKWSRDLKEEAFKGHLNTIGLCAGN